MAKEDSGEPRRWVKMPDLSSMTDDQIDQWAKGAWAELASRPTQDGETVPDEDDA